MAYTHLPVLLAEVIEALKCSNGRIIVDCTVGGAGHAEAILNLISPNGFLLAIDQDIKAIEAAKVRLARFSQQTLFLQGNFRDIDHLLMQAGLAYVDGFLLDLGFSLPQVQEAERGFSYKAEAFLDMRYNREQKLTAAEIVNTYPPEKLTTVIKRYGEEKWASRIVKFIVQRRQRQPVETTTELVEIIKAAIPASARRRGPHPAKRTFQALRIEVNDELNSLRQALEAMPKWLSSGGRIVVISYHSLEDRLVKVKFNEFATADKPILKVITKKPVRPSKEEIAKNPAARSAKMRVAEKI